MKNKKASSKLKNKTLTKRGVKKTEPILLKKVNNIDKLFTKKDIKNIVDSVINHNEI